MLSLSVLANIMQIYKPFSRSVNYLSQSCQQRSIQPVKLGDQELVSWNGGINGMSEQAPLCTPSSLDRSQPVPLALDYTRIWLVRPKPNQEPVRRL